MSIVQPLVAALALVSWRLTCEVERCFLHGSASPGFRVLAAGFRKFRWKKCPRWRILGPHRYLRDFTS